MIKENKKAVKSYIFFYSHFKNSYTKFSINEDVKFYKSFKDEINLWSFEYFNTLVKNKFKNFDDLLKNPLKVEQEIKIRQKMFGHYNLSPIIVLNNINLASYEFIAKSEIYFDSKEKIFKY